MLTYKQKLAVAKAYTLAEDEQDRAETIECLAKDFETTQMDIRQILQDFKVFVKKEGKTVKQQYAKALWSLTNIPEREWMKLTFDSQQKIMEIFKRSNQEAKLTDADT